MAWLSDRQGQIFISGFVGFFLAPAAAVVMLIIWAPESVDYGNSGLVLLVSVLTGGLFGAVVGAIEFHRPARSEFAEEMTWLDDLWDHDLDS